MEKINPKVIRSVEEFCHKKNIFRLILREFILATFQGKVNRG